VQKQHADVVTTILLKHVKHSMSKQTATKNETADGGKKRSKRKPGRERPEK